MTATALKGMAPQKILTLPQATIQRAKAAVGVMEAPPGSNWGDVVREYLLSVGIHSAAPWCAAFVNYQIKAAAKQLKVRSKWFGTPSCTSIHVWAKKNGYLLAGPEEGCVFILFGLGSDGARYYHHTGLVVSVNADGSVNTIEGNTNDDGSSEGIGVFARVRHHTDQLEFVKIV